MDTMGWLERIGLVLIGFSVVLMAIVVIHDTFQGHFDATYTLLLIFATGSFFAHWPRRKH